MNIPVKVKLKNALSDVTTVADDELHNLIQQGLVTYHDALAALKNADVALDKRFYPWLRDVENAATGEFNSANASQPKESKPELLSKKAEQAVKAQPEPDSKDAA